MTDLHRFLLCCIAYRSSSHSIQHVQVNMLGKTKGTIEQLEPVVAWDPPPCYVSHFSKLREGYAAAKVGLTSRALIAWQSL